MAKRQSQLPDDVKRFSQFVQVEQIDPIITYAAKDKINKPFILYSWDSEVGSFGEYAVMTCRSLDGTDEFKIQGGGNLILDQLMSFPTEQLPCVCEIFQHGVKLALR